MKIHLWSIGKAHDHMFRDAIEDFTKRINMYFPCEWKIIAPPKLSSGEMDLKKKESETVLNLIGRDDYLIALDERGKQLTSQSLSVFLQDRANESVKNIIFLVGGAYGLDEPVLRRAQFKMSLSSLTFPHQLVRVIIAEQVYRACTIMRNERYHHA